MGLVHEDIPTDMHSHKEIGREGEERRGEERRGEERRGEEEEEVHTPVAPLRPSTGVPPRDSLPR